MNPENDDLTPQFLDDFDKLRRDFEELQKRANHASAPTASPEELARLEAEVARLCKEREEAANREAELKRQSDTFAASQRRLEEAYAETLGQKERALQNTLFEASRMVEQANAAKQAELARKTQELEEKAKSAVAAETGELARRFDARLASAWDTALSDLEDALAEIAFLPLRMRVAALVLDTMLVVAVSEVVRVGTAWGQGLSEKTFILATLGAFALRTFGSPGNWLLGISARQIGPDLRPRGPVGLKTRLLCGLLHYGPLLATGVVAVSDEATTRALGKLGQWAYDPTTSPQTLSSLLVELLRPTSLDLPGAILVMTLVWWGILLVSVVFSSSIHTGTPYFRNTTLVESMWRVGFRRFVPPALKPPRLDVAG